MVAIHGPDAEDRPTGLLAFQVGDELGLMDVETGGWLQCARPLDLREWR